MLKKFRAELTEITFMPWWRRLWAERKDLSSTPNGPSTGGGPVSPTDLENEETWLRAVIICLRTPLRFAKLRQPEWCGVRYGAEIARSGVRYGARRVYSDGRYDVAWCLHNSSRAFQE